MFVGKVFHPQTMKGNSKRLQIQGGKMLIIKNPHINESKVLPLPYEILNEDKYKPFKYVATNALLIAGVLVFGYEVDAFASTNLDAKAKEFYFEKFLSVVKWIIVGKGGWATVSKALGEDFEGAKKAFIQYFMIFASLYLLPVGLGLIEDFFKDEI